jgi:hypothetical protein
MYGDAFAHVHEADEGWVAAVVDAEAAVESGVGKKAAPSRADGGCARERGGQRGETEEDLGEKIIVFQRRRHLRRVHNSNPPP